MSSLETNKIVAAVLVAGLIAMVTGIVAETLVPHPHVTETAYNPAGVEGGAQTAAAPPAAAPEIEPIAPLLASASAEEGQKAVRVCAACHTFEQGGPNRVGPNLWNVVGNESAHLEGFNYSQAMASADLQWTYENLNKFLANPRSFMKGTRMAFAGLKDAEDRADVIAYLRSLSDSPQPLPQ